MIRIKPLRVIEQSRLWLRAAVGVLVGIPLGMMIVQTPAEPEPPVGITEVVVKVGSYVCRGNEGLKTVYRHGRRSDVYTFHCNDQAEFNEIPVTQQQPIPSSAVLKHEEDWRNAH